MTVTIIRKNGERIRQYKKSTAQALAQIINEDRDKDTCYTCVNYVGGTCKFRLHSPDYIDAKVSPGDLACGSFGVPSTKVPTAYEPVFQGIDHTDGFGYLGATTVAEGVGGSGHTYRKVLSMEVIPVDALHRLGHDDQQYPVISVSCQHNGEHVVFYLPNTKIEKVYTKERKFKIAGNRYDVVNLFKRISDKGTIDLRNWRRLQLIAE